ncbi:hypothetical protein, conserved [Trypanosoma brucei gambiense DAL972]|uniref:Uncharacterized protein n=1 Tax=Trypanosoma brucei gambiense (strain MHOM/CI/86/DAL972) TaxID=679716 RepID=C9ZRV3_TRYB9|nr:hypothetical protein, conserved [Trypanosoma brucei gambiense DAL972]CBH12089.1 hypothetical protein, conserved [Trypanosoma brucei gambiense DAL972]|eukprot:XP_011774372.1 hypothetical protein, conserved [Trypanosoma brucei gambiense DAL972]
MMENSLSTTITTDVIKRICVKTGFYRNPVCNEKLYLHNKGFDSIEEGAFDPYTDVKVLWLEGNAFTVIHCGKDSQPCNVQAEGQGAGTEEEVNAYTEASATDTTQVMSKSAHLDCCADWLERSQVDSSGAAGCVRSAEYGINSKTDGAAALAFKSTAIKSSCNAGRATKDVFQSLYPTLRQLYLHNNALRRMPDLSSFQFLDSVNLSSNCIRSVEVSCAPFDKKAAQYEEELTTKANAIVANSKSMQRELNSSPIGGKLLQQQSDEITEDATGSAEITQEEGIHINEKVSGDGCDVGNAINDPGREGNLESWCKRLDAYASFCPHKPLDPLEDGKPLSEVPDEYRTPCSSLRTLNLACNYLTAANDIIQLLCYKNLSVLDLSNNQLADGEAVLLVLERVYRLRALKLSGNPLVRTIPRYRKTVLARCSKLFHLDDRPVFDGERRLVTAWARGGDEAEKKELLLMKQEERDQHMRRLREFRETLGLAAHGGLGASETVRLSASGAHVERYNDQGRDNRIFIDNGNVGNINDDAELTSSETGEEDSNEAVANGTNNNRRASGNDAPPAFTSNTSHEGISDPEMWRDVSVTNFTGSDDEDDDGDIFIPPRN